MVKSYSETNLLVIYPIFVTMKIIDDLSHIWDNENHKLCVPYLGQWKISSTTFIPNTV